LQQISAAQKKLGRSGLSFGITKGFASETRYALKVECAVAQGNRTPFIIHRMQYVLLRKKLGRSGFEPLKAMPADLQSAPFGHFGTYPFFTPSVDGGFERMQSLPVIVHQKVRPAP